MTLWPSEPDDRLRRELRTLADSSSGQWAFSVRERDRLEASVYGDVAMPAASTIKVPLLILALQDVAAGRLTLDEELPVPGDRVGGAGVLKVLSSVRRIRLDEALELMIGVSDNTAANMVIDLLGLDEISGRIAGLGAGGTRLERRLMDAEAARAGRDNVTTADDQALLLDLLAGPGLLPPGLRRFALDVLGRQQFNDRMPAALGPDVRCLHKTGELPGVRHDVGILAFDDRQVAFAALGSGLTDPAHGDGTGPAGRIIATAARLVVEDARA